MSRDIRDGKDAHDQNAERLYNRDGAQPLPPPGKGEFYSYDPAVAVVERRGTELFAEAGIDSAGQRALADTFREIRRSTGLPDRLVGRIADAHLNNLIADERVPENPDAEDVKLLQQIDTWNSEVRHWFTAQYGRDGEGMLDRTQRFVRKHPALAKILQHRNLGSRPEFVREIAEHVFSIGWRG